LALVQLKALEPARADFTRAIALDPSSPEPYIERAAVRASEGNLPEAEADLTRALEAGGEPVRGHLFRASVRQQRDDKVGARADREEGLRLAPVDDRGWVARGIERLSADPHGALADAEEALKRNPFSVPALQLKAHILGERLNRADDALAVLDRAV